MNIVTEIAALKQSYAYSPEAVAAISDATRIMSNYLEYTVEKSKKKATKSAALPDSVTNEVMRQIPEELSTAVLTQIKELSEGLVKLHFAGTPIDSTDDLIAKSLTELASKFPEVASIAKDEHNALLLQVFFHACVNTMIESIDKHSSEPLEAKPI